MSTSKHIVLNHDVTGFVVTDLNGQVANKSVAQPPSAPPAPPEEKGPDLDAIRRAAFAEGEAKARQEATTEKRKMMAIWQKFEAAYEEFQQDAKEQIAAFSATQQQGVPKGTKSLFDEPKDEFLARVEGVADFVSKGRRKKERPQGLREKE